MIGTVTSAQEPSVNGPETKRLQDVVNEVADLVVEYHLFPDVGQACAEHIRSRMAAGAYDDIRDPARLAQVLTADLHSVKKDAHLRVEFGPPYSVQDESLDPEEVRRRQYATYGRNNFGFLKLEVLDGTIGYLDLRVFAPVDIARDTAVAAMNFLANSEAIILDLRNNPGGIGDMVHLIASYFFAGRTHLISYETRGEKRVKKVWTSKRIKGKRIPETPLFILTSQETASAAEEFAYDLKHHGRATVIGETTAGGGHSAYVARAADIFNVVIPHSRPIHPVTGTDWDGVGVQPHIEVPASLALPYARLEALKAIENRAGRKEPSLKVKWAAETIEAKKHPVTVPEKTLAKYVGDYGPIVVSIKNGALWAYCESDRFPYRLTPLSETRFAAEREEELPPFEVRVEFTRDRRGKIVAVQIERADMDHSVELKRER
jgi:hypothetical protein